MNTDSPQTNPLAEQPLAGEAILGETPKTTAGTAVPPRLPVDVVQHIHRLVGGDAHVEDMVLKFIGDQYGAPNLLYLPPAVASQIIKRPADFLRAVKQHCEPELSFRTGNNTAGCKPPMLL